MARQAIIMIGLVALCVGTHKKHPPPATAPPPAAAPRPAEAVAGLPVPAGLESRIEFWTQIFSEIPSSRTLVYHRDHPEIIYSRIRFDWLNVLSSLFAPQDLEKIRARREAEVVNKYRQLLARLASLAKEPGGLAGLDPAHPDYYRLKRLASLFEGIPDPDKFAQAAGPGMIRVQRGRADEFERSYRRAYPQLSLFEDIFQDEGVPPALTRLVFIESMFQAEAVSPAGAAGLWQLMPDTGRQYLTINETKDERLDTWRSTRAAAQLLRANYQRLQSWPLAVTAYNTGPSRMKRASNRLLTQNLADIISDSDEPGFGFAGKNFYAELLGLLAAERSLKSSHEGFPWLDSDSALSAAPAFVPQLIAD